MTQLRRSVGVLPAAERPAAGKLVNEAVEAMEAMLAAQRPGAFRIAAGSKRELGRSIDVTFWSIAPANGSINPVRRIVEDACAYFRERGFAVVIGPEAEPDYYNFDALNIPRRPPGARRLRLVLGLPIRSCCGRIRRRCRSGRCSRTRPPIAIVAPGKCFRRDAVDARHLFQFHQIEGLLIARGHPLRPSQRHARRNVPAAFRPLPERAVPSVVLSVHRAERRGRHDLPEMRRCTRGLPECAAVRAGSSSVVREWCTPTCCAKSATIPSVYSGWAFGFGVERLGLPRYDVDDIRRFIDSDPDFLEQLA